MRPDGSIYVLTVGMDDRKQAIFRMAFKMYSVQRYVLTDDAPDAQPHLAIVDMDNMDALVLWQEFLDQYPDLPALMVSGEEIPKPPVPALIKPIRVETLFPALRQVLAGDAAADRAAAPAAPVAEVPGASADKSANEPKPDRTATLETAVPKPVPSSAPPKPVGPAPVPEPAPPPRPQYQLPEVVEHFDPGLGMLGLLRAIQAKRKSTVVLSAGRPVLIAMPEQERVLILDREAIREACVNDTPVTARLLTSEDKLEASEIAGLSSVIWQVALWTSRGRLVSGVNINTPVRLRHWPNLTRLAPVPNGLRIAAFWVRCPVNLRLTMRMLNLPAGEIFDFLAASYSLGILEIGAERPGVVTAVPSSQESPAAKERGGLLSRLLRKVVGL